MTDTERLDWLERSEAFLVTDDEGFWAVSFAFDFDWNKRSDPDLSMDVCVQQPEWQPSIRGAIDRAMKEQS